ncbi:MAG: 50S ribosomal protein L13 [Parachlamydiaceae bacterium]|nr:50S ribosomal protein L13 [Parachlamydiaceae bacterium]
MQRNAQHPKTFIPKENKEKLTWFILDAAGKTLGRMASEITKILRGKHKPIFTTYMDCGDGVIVINADQIQVTGSKEAQKIYHYYTGSMKGLRKIPYRVMKSRNSPFIIEHAVKGMMPKTRLGNAQLKKFRVFAGAEHNLSAQQPIHVNI